jgi:hypothetical protein
LTEFRSSLNVASNDAPTAGGVLASCLDGPQGPGISCRQPYWAVRLPLWGLYRLTGTGKDHCRICIV